MEEQKVINLDLVRNRKAIFAEMQKNQLVDKIDILAAFEKTITKSETRYVVTYGEQTLYIRDVADIGLTKDLIPQTFSESDIEWLVGLGYVPRTAWKYKPADIVCKVQEVRQYCEKKISDFIWQIKNIEGIE